MTVEQIKIPKGYCFPDYVTVRMILIQTEKNNFLFHFNLNYIRKSKLLESYEDQFLILFRHRRRLWSRFCALAFLTLNLVLGRNFRTAPQIPT